MARFVYPDQEDLVTFVESLSRKEYPIAKYLPLIGSEWFPAIMESVSYVEQTEAYAGTRTMAEASARLLYKIVKKHEFSDGNKRSAVIVVFLFALLNDCHVRSPDGLQALAQRIARTKGRTNEQLICKRAAAEMGILMASDPGGLAEAA